VISVEAEAVEAVEAALDVVAMPIAAAEVHQGEAPFLQLMDILLATTLVIWLPRKHRSFHGEIPLRQLPMPQWIRRPLTHITQPRKAPDGQVTNKTG
jgi:hypothetical protein